MRSVCRRAQVLARVSGDNLTRGEIPVAQTVHTYANTLSLNPLPVDDNLARQKYRSLRGSQVYFEYCLETGTQFYPDAAKGLVTDLLSGLRLLAGKDFSMGRVMLNRSFRSIHDFITTSHMASLFVVCFQIPAYIIYDTPQNMHSDMFKIYLGYVYEISKQKFGPNHPLTDSLSTLRTIMKTEPEKLQAWMSNLMDVLEDGCLKSGMQNLTHDPAILRSYCDLVYMRPSGTGSKHLLLQTLNHLDSIVYAKGSGNDSEWTPPCLSYTLLQIQQNSYTYLPNFPERVQQWLNSSAEAGHGGMDLEQNEHSYYSLLSEYFFTMGDHEKGLFYFKKRLSVSTPDTWIRRCLRLERRLKRYEKNDEAESWQRLRHTLQDGECDISTLMARGYIKSPTAGDEEEQLAVITEEQALAVIEFCRKAKEEEQAEMEMQEQFVALQV